MMTIITTEIVISEISHKMIRNDLNEDQEVVAGGCDWQLDRSQSSDPDHMSSLTTRCRNDDQDHYDDD